MDVSPYIGIPFVEKGRDRAGLDCWGLVRLLYQEQFGLDVPSYVEAYRTVYDGEEIAAAIEGRSHLWVSMPEAEAEPGDVLLLQVRGRRWHVGVLLAERKFLHADLRLGVVIERLDQPLWERRVAGVYRHPDRMASGEWQVAS